MYRLVIDAHARPPDDLSGFARDLADRIGADADDVEVIEFDALRGQRAGLVTCVIRCSEVPDGS